MSRLIWRGTLILFLITPLLFSALHNTPARGSPTRTLLEEIPPDTEYLMVYPRGWAENLQPLVVWWNRAGIRTVAVEYESAVGEGEGRDPPEKLHSLISEVYERGGGALRYLLLAGDSEVIPTRELYVGEVGEDLDEFYPSDIYYGSPGSSWDTDGDGIYGEEGEWDFSLPVMVGRFPASSPDELSRMVREELRYLTEPQEGNWSRRVVMAGSLMDPPNNPNLYEAYKDNAFKALKETEVFIPTYMNKVELTDYPYMEGGNYTPSVDTLNHTNLISSLLPGAALFLFAGQSFYADNPPPLDNSLAEYSDPLGYSRYSFYPLLTYLDGENLTFSVRRPFAYISSCDSGRFTEEDDTNLERLLLTAEGGFSGIVASTGVSYRGETLNGSFGNWWLFKEFVRRLFQGPPRPAEALWQLKRHYFASIYPSCPFPEGVVANLYSYVLLGDPAMWLWLGDIRELEVSCPSYVYSGKSTVEVEVKDGVYGTPVVGARVTLYNPVDGEFFTALTGEGGVASLATEFNLTTDVVYLTVTRESYRPYMRDNITLKAPPADLYIAGVTPPEGLVEGRVGVWEVAVGNSGTSAAPGFTLEVSERGVTLHKSSHGPLPPFGTVTLRMNLSLAWGWHNLTFEVESLGEEGNTEDNTLSVSVYVDSPPVALPGVLFRTEEDSPPIFCPLSSIVYDRETPPEELTLEITYVTPPGAVVEVLDNGTVMVAPQTNLSGEIRVGYAVSDGLAETTGEFSVIVSRVNDPPRILNLKETYLLPGGSLFTLALQVEDDGPPPLTFSISPSFIPVDSESGLISFVPYENMSGIYRVNITVTDGGGLSSSAYTTFIISTEESRLRIDPSLVKLRAEVGKRTVYQVKVFGARRANLTFSDDTDLFDIDPKSGLIVFTPTKEQKGLHWVTIEVRNDLGESDSRLILVEVVEAEEKERDLALILLAPIAVLAAILLYLLIMPPHPPHPEE
ncbi:MAG: hypothetical protein DRN40_01120 [Thermoplasmata archaeon]|nr:MAG: hypothetical protein DRN40_01120 [Thermoplasmata archaeon]